MASNELYEEPCGCNLCQEYGEFIQRKTTETSTRPTPVKWDGVIKVEGSELQQESKAAVSEHQQSSELRGLLLFYPPGPESSRFHRLLLRLVDEFFSDGKVQVIATKALRNEGRLLADPGRFGYHHGPKP